MEPQTQTLFTQTPGEEYENSQNIERAQSGARWFYWIAALSLITSVISLMAGSGASSRASAPRSS